MNGPGPSPSFAGAVVLPSYNSGAKLLKTTLTALAAWPDVWVVVDGSTDGSDQPLNPLRPAHPGLRVFRRPENGGKGAAVLDALRLARTEGVTHLLVMDADGQHPAEWIAPFFRLAEENPRALVLGQPNFGPDAPPLRVHGRKAGNFFTNLNTAFAGVGDSLFGFRVYPAAASLAIMEGITTARRYDFDTELVVRLCWEGFRPLNVPVPVRYFAPSEGGSSYFRYVPDNLLLIRRHAALFFGMLARLPRLLARRARGQE